nr:MAG TPA: tail tape measure protein [Caudoviricetes sp.]
MSEELKIIIKAEVAQLKKSIADAKKEMGSFKEQVSKHSKEASSSIKKMGEHFADVGKKIAKAMATAAVAVGASLVALGKKALDSYGDYEQLVGGIETLFKDSSSVVMAYARDAYKNQQMSANQYMEIATSFSASLLQGLNGDTAEAARIADMAITDMADNANKMGSTMESIQNAYQGFAKQNYTMLDNLKLGYGGTKEEMERLLADAEKISGVHYDISNLNDVYEAIHVVQTEMGITGTSAEEAATTIQGSVAMMKSAWTNWVTGLMDENANMKELTANLVSSVGQVVENVVPKIGEFFSNLVEGIHEGLAEHPKIQEAFDSIVSALGTVRDIITGVFSYVSENWETIKGILTAAAIAVGVITTAVIAYNAVQAIKEAMDVAQVATLGALITAQLSLAAATLVALAPYILIVAAIAAVIAIIVVCIKHWDEIKAKVVEVWDAIVEKIKNAVESVKEWFSNLKQGISDKVEAIKTVVADKFNAVKEKILSPVRTAVEKVKDFIDKIKSFFKFEWSLPKLKMPHLKIQGEFSLVPPKVPKFSIDWYARGGVFDKPTLFNGGGRIGGLGEAGAEAIVPLENNTQWLDKIAEKLSSKMGSVPIILQVDGKTFAEISVDSINALTRQRGSLGINLV